MLETTSHRSLSKGADAVLCSADSPRRRSLVLRRLKDACILYSVVIFKNIMLCVGAELVHIFRIEGPASNEFILHGAYFWVWYAGGDSRGDTPGGSAFSRPHACTPAALLRLWLCA